MYFLRNVYYIKAKSTGSKKYENCTFKESISENDYDTLIPV